MAQEVQLGHIPAHVVRKDIKHIHLRIIESTNEVRISVPRHMPIETAQSLAMTKFDWLSRRLEELRVHHQVPIPTGTARTQCYLWGQRLRFTCAATDGQAQVVCNATTVTVLHHAGATPEHVDALLAQWYRQQLDAALPAICEKWESAMGVVANRLSIQRMKTRWGSSNNATRTIRINLEMAKKPIECLEYLFVHELTHFFHNGHGPGFQAAMDHWLPNWRELSRTLDNFPRD